MTPGKTLTLYIAARFLAWCAGVFGAMVFIVFLLDYIELIRRGVERPDATMLVLLQLAALKQPQMAEQIMPFAILFGTMMLFWQMTRSNELVVARAAGVSAWQFLAPAVATAFAVGVFSITVFNPIAAITQARYENLESRILHSSSEQMSFARSGFWLRQSDETGSAAVIHANRMRMADARLEGVTFLTYVNDTHLTGRIDAKTAALDSGNWIIADGFRWAPGLPQEPFKRLVLSTNLTPSKIQDGFAAPETMSFWQLPGFIALLESSGFSAQRHRLYFDALLARPFLLTAMVLLAAVCSLRMQRRGGVTLMIAVGIGSGFALYFFSDVVFALGLSDAIPVSLAAWIPTGVSWLVGASLLFHLEDG